MPELIAVGSSPISKKLYDIFKDSKTVCIYPCFFDDKNDLIKKNYHSYLRKVWDKKRLIKFALYPDYVRYVITFPSHINFIYPVHSLDEIDVVKNVIAKKYNIIYGYASDKRYRNYTLEDFLSATKGEKRWYLGVSTKRELKEVKAYNFDYFDITTMALGSFKDIKNIDFVIKQIRKLATSLTTSQTTLF